MRRFLLALVITGLCLTDHAGSAEKTQDAPPSNVSPATKPYQSSSAEQAAREESVRRQAAQQTARHLISDAQALYSSGKLQEAASKYEEALKILPRGKATEVDYANATHGLTECYYRLADTAYRAGDKVKARQLAQKALEYDPKNRSAENLIVKIKMEDQRAQELAGKQPPAAKAPPPNKTPEFTQEREDISKLFREGKILLDSGQYDEAVKRYQQILLLDPYNADAESFLNEINTARLNFANDTSEKARSRRLWEVAQSWVPPVGREIQAPKTTPGSGPIGTGGAKSAAILQKLNDIIIPEINFRDAVITDVVKFLSDESRKLDVPDHTGINIVTQLELGAAPTPEPTPPVTEPGVPPPPAPTGGVSGVRTITLSLRNIPLIEALKYVTSVAGLKFRVEPNAILILPKDAPEGDLITRSYPVSPGALETLVTKPTTGGFRIGEATSAATGIQAITEVAPGALKEFFTEAGVPFPPGSSLAYNKRTSTIIVRNTPENMEIFERILATLNIVPSQVEIEAKFVDITQQDLNELGFSWKVGSKQFGQVTVEGGTPGGPPGSLQPQSPGNSDIITSGLRESSLISGGAIDALLASQGFGALTTPRNDVFTVRSILTDPQFEVVVRMLAQKGGADVLSAPKVTTISGAQAQVKVVKEFIYPTEYDPPQVVAAGGGTQGGGSVGVTPSTPSSFKTREIGVLLNVTPTVGPDGYTINLTLVPEVSEFLGFINYGGPIAIAAGNNVVQAQNDIKQPLFATRTLTTSIVIWDGQTVVLGGLIREDIRTIDDKVPFLGDIPMIGRLFRSKVTSRQKSNLLIFVTARMIDPAGNLIHRQEITGLK